jgi:hypothetical protein
VKKFVWRDSELFFKSQNKGGSMFQVRSLVNPYFYVLLGVMRKAHEIGTSVRERDSTHSRKDICVEQLVASCRALEARTAQHI